MNSPVDSPPEAEVAVETHPAAEKSRWLRLGAVAAIIALTLGAALLTSRMTRGPGRTTLQNSVSNAGRAGQTLRLKGTTMAAEARSIAAPLLAGQQISTLTITHLIPSGTRVKRGDLLVDFDRQEQERNIIDKRSQSSDENDKVLEEQAKEVAARAKDETEIKQAEDDLSKAQLEMQKVELLSRIDAEKAQETLDEAKATLTQLKQTFDLKRKAAAASIRILEIQRDRTRETMMHAEANAEQMEIHAPIDGIVVFNTIWKQGSMGEVKEGDQVRPGVPFMQVVDPSIMEVQVPVNQMDLPMLTVGQKAQVHLDAYPDMVLQGQVESIDPMGRSGDFSAKLRTFSATFSIQGNDPRLMPDLSAAVDVHAAFTPDAKGSSAK